MKTKRVLIPELKPKTRKKDRKIGGRTEKDRGKVLHISERQRSEAVGLIMIGISAFFLSLLHYLSTTKISRLVQFLTVQIGMGVYIIPLIIGIMGIQRFLDKPFQNITHRIVGMFFALLFGLGLMGFEGGKLGATFFALVSEQMGKVPTTLLFSFFFLSAMVFALDILYKDLLKILMLFILLVFRCGYYLYQILLEGLALLIEAAKTTVLYAFHASTLLRNVFLNANSTAGGSQKMLIPFRSENCENDEEIIENPPIESALNHNEPLQEKINVSSQESLFPKIFPKTSESESERASVAIENKPLIETAQVASFTVIGAEYSMGGFFPELQIYVPEKNEPKAELKTVEEKIAPKPEDEAPVPAKIEDEIPVVLEDNTIDREIKKNSNESPIVKSRIKEHPLPPIELLTVPSEKEISHVNDLADRSALLLKTLEDFGINARISEVVEGPVVSRFELKPAPGVKISRITSLSDDISLVLASPVRIEAPIHGKAAIGIEIPNLKPNPVFFYDLVKHDKFRGMDSLLTLALGVTIAGRPVFADLTDMPHLLIAGSTGSGKSVCVNTIIASILFQARSDQVKMVMIDPKLVELSSYNGIPHLISPVVTDPKEASSALIWAVEEMERRYELLAGCQVRKISTYNEEIDRIRSEFDDELTPIPYIVIIIDELADLMMTASAQVEGSICRLAQMARAVGIHLIIATQRPSVDVLTGIIKANLPSRIAFSVASHIDSRTILDSKGAERLLGKGDMLFVPKGRSKPLRLQGAFISDRELQNIIDYVRGQGEPEYLDIAPNLEEKNDSGKISGSNDEDSDTELMSKIENYLATQEKTSTSMLQRKFKIGYNRAARIMDLLEEKGIVSPADGSNKRRVIGKRSGS